MISFGALSKTLKDGLSVKKEFIGFSIGEYHL